MNKLFLIGLILFTGCNAQLKKNEHVLGTVSVPEESLSPPGLFTEAKKVRSIELQSEQVLRLNGEVGVNIDNLIVQLNKLNKDKKVKEIYVLIDSPGGSVLDGARFVSAIEASSKPVYTVCTAMCASMAAIIHQYGSKRFMLDRSLLMFHDAAGALQGPLPQMRSRLNFFDRLTTKMDAYIAKRAGVDLTEFMNSLHSEVWIDAEDSTTKHFNDEIVYVVVEGEDILTILTSKTDHSKLINLENK